MRRYLIGLACACALMGALASCKKIERGPATSESTGPLVVTAMQSGGEIPLSYGRLAGVTHDAANPGFAVLWFERDDQAVMAVWVDTARLRVATALEIPRR